MRHSKNKPTRESRSAQVQKKCERQEEVKVTKRARTNKDTYKKKGIGQEEALGNKVRSGGKWIGARRTGTMR